MAKQDLNFLETYELLRDACNPKKNKDIWFRKETRRRNAFILLIQLRNGSRISEAIEAYNKFKNTHDYTVSVRIRKRGYEYEVVDGKRRRKRRFGDPEKLILRTMKIPEEVRWDFPYYEGTDASLGRWCLKTFGFNSHSLRYSYITFMSSKGYSPQVIAKTTGQKTLNLILDYTLEKLGDEALDHVLDD